MARRRRGVPIHGWIVLDKDAGLTSAHAVAKVRRMLNAAKVGHAGTLDPMATGILPIALGEATKTVAYAMDGEKEYAFTVRWGEARDTDDAEGRVTETSDLRPDEEAIHQLLPRFTGRIEQVPPAYSAIKVDGERAYDLARADEEVKLQPRQVDIDRLALVDMPDTNHARFRMVCGKGAYVRSLARDLGRALGCLGHVTELRRTRVGPFDLDAAISLAQLDELRHIPPPQSYLLPVETALDDIPALALSETEAARLRSGQSVSVMARSRSSQVRMLNSGSIVFAKTGNTPVALARYEAGDIHPVRVLNL